MLLQFVHWLVPCSSLFLHPVATRTGRTLRPSWRRRCQAEHRCSRRPCHKRAIHSRHDLSRADNHGQHQDGLDLHRSLAPQVAILPVACKQVVGQCLHRPCRARPADRSLVAEDRSPGGVRDQTGPAGLTHAIPWGRPCRRSRWPSRGTGETIGHHGRRSPNANRPIHGRAATRPNPWRPWNAGHPRRPHAGEQGADRACPAAASVGPQALHPGLHRLPGGTTTGLAGRPYHQRYGR